MKRQALGWPPAPHQRSGIGPGRPSTAQAVPSFFLGKHFPLPVQKLTTATPHRKTRSHLSFHMLFQIFAFNNNNKFNFNIICLFQDEQDIGYLSFFPPMDKSWAVPDLCGQAPNSMLRRPGKPRWGSAFSQFSALKHGLKAWQSFT